MPFKKNSGPITFDVNPEGIREIVDEKNNMAIIMQEVAWNGRQAHLEIRKWMIDETGEKPNKGFSFMTEEGPHNLTKALVNNGFGKTDELLESLKKRDDFDDSLVKAIGKKKVVESKNTETEISSDDYFDPASMFGEE